MEKKECIYLFEQYISGKASDEEIERLRTYFENDPALNTWFNNRIISSSDCIDDGLKVKMFANIRSQIQDNEENSSRRYKEANVKYNIRRIANIAAIILPFILLFAFYLFLKPNNINTYEMFADKGQKASLILPEGSKITINSNSRITYNSSYNQKERRVTLKGEAFFRVVHNAEKPFIVQCEEVNIMVLGTTFGIKAYEDENNISVVLNSGKIRLITPSERIEMNPNERIIYNKTTHQTSIEKVNAEDFTDWSKNRLRFENEPLEIIMKAISRMHNISIILDNSDIKNLRFTGTIDNTNIESAMHAITLTSSISYKLRDGVIHLYKN
jgi:Fe2+-dicitrate sensor, membrane component